MIISSKDVSQEADKSQLMDGDLWYPAMVNREDPTKFALREFVFAREFSRYHRHKKES